MLTKGQIRVLGLLLTSKDREIVCDGLACMIGYKNVARRSVRGLLMHMAIKDAGYTGVGCDIYCPTPNSNAIYQRPALADEMVARVYANKPFFIDKDGVITDA